MKKKSDELHKNKTGYQDTANMDKRVEESQLESAEKYQNILKNIHDGCFELDLAGNFTFFNDSVCRILGYSRKELMGMNYRHYTDKENAKKVSEAYLKVYNTGESSKGFGWQVTRKDGAKRYIETSVSLQKDSSGKPTGFIGIVNDITERKQAEEQYRTLVEKASDIVFRTDDSGHFTFVNPVTLRITGYSEEEILGKHYKILIRSDKFKETITLLANQLINKTQNTYHEFPIFTKDGREIWLGQNTQLLVEDDQVTGFQAVARDVTERKKAEEELKKEQLFNTAILDSVPGILYLYDETGHLVHWNKQNEEVTGYSSEELKGMHVLDWFGGVEPDTSNIINSIEAVMKNGHSMIEARIINKSGHAIPMILTGVKLAIDGKDHLLGIGIDITDRKKAEEALKNSEEKYRNIFEKAVEGIYQTTIEGRIITANAAIARMAGYDSPEELMESVKDIGTQLYVHPKDRKRFMEIREAKGFVDGFEVEFYKKDGSKFWVVINARTVKDEQGKILYIEGLIEDITIRKYAEEQLHQTLDSLRKSVDATIQVMVAAIEMRDPYTAGHQIRTADLARAIATEMGLPKDKIDGIRMAGSIHDIGKLSIPAEILSKPTKLTDIEFSLIKEHSRSGYEMLKDVESPWSLADIVYQHHERMDGSGYPRNLKGDEILIEARIMAVADVVEAMASHRPYRPGLGIDAALAEIERNKGTHYDNTVADACLRLFREKGYQLK
jgi:PAS domain S-box-containing protein/putative nucleotidyltransferase with HDIG domain